MNTILEFTESGYTYFEMGPSSNFLYIDYEEGFTFRYIFASLSFTKFAITTSFTSLLLPSKKIILKAGHFPDIKLKLMLMLMFMFMLMFYALCFMLSTISFFRTAGQFIKNFLFN